MTISPSGSGAGRVDEADAMSAGWRVLRMIGFVLLVVGVLDLALAWFPLRFGTPEWEFGTISATLNNMPVPAMGLALLLAYAAAERNVGVLVAVAVWGAVMTVFLSVAAVFYGLDVPLALRAVQNPVALRGLKTGMIKAVISLIGYGGFHVWAAVFAIRRMRR